MMWAAVARSPVMVDRQPGGHLNERLPPGTALCLGDLSRISAVDLEATRVRGSVYLTYPEGDTVGGAAPHASSSMLSVSGSGTISPNGL